MKTLSRNPESMIKFRPFYPVPPSSPPPSITWLKSGTLGWALIGAGVLVWDLAGPETLSDAFDRCLASKATRGLVVGGWMILTLHLFNLLPEKADPLHLLSILRDHIHEIDCCADPWPDDII